MRTYKPYKSSFVDLFQQARQQNARGLDLTDVEYTNGSWTGTYGRSRGNAQSEFSFDNFGEFQRDVASQQRQDLTGSSPEYAKSQWYNILDDILGDQISGRGTSPRSNRGTDNSVEIERKYDLVGDAIDNYRLGSGQDTDFTDTTSNGYKDPVEIVFDEQIRPNLVNGTYYDFNH